MSKTITREQFRELVRKTWPAYKMCGYGIDEWKTKIPVNEDCERYSDYDRFIEEKMTEIEYSYNHPIRRWLHWNIPSIAQFLFDWPEARR